MRHPRTPSLADLITFARGAAVVAAVAGLAVAPACTVRAGTSAPAQSPQPPPPPPPATASPAPPIYPPPPAPPYSPPYSAPPPSSSASTTIAPPTRGAAPLPANVVAAPVTRGAAPPAADAVVAPVTRGAAPQSTAPAGAYPGSAPGAREGNRHQGHHQGRGDGLERQTDRPGADFQTFDLPRPDPEICQRACWDNPVCRAFTFVSPGVQGPNARCFLKNAVPQPNGNVCCVSGVR